MEKDRKPNDRHAVNSQGSENYLAKPVHDVYSRPAQRKQKVQKTRRKFNKKFLLLVAVAILLALTVTFCASRGGKNRQDSPVNAETVQSDPTTLPATEPITEPTTEPITEPVPESTTEATSEPTTESTTEATAESETTLPPLTEPVKANLVQKGTISATGDVLMHMPVIKSGYSSKTKKYSFTKIFQYIDTYVSQADFAVANLETTLAGTNNGYEYSGYPQFNCPDSITTALKKTGFDMVLTSNNHCNDTGTVGLKRTLEVSAEAGLVTLGTQAKDADPDYVVQDVNGIKVGMMCYSYATSDKYPDRPTMNGILVNSKYTQRVNYFDYDQLSTFYKKVNKEIAAMKAEGAEAVVMFIHWGEEYTLEPNSRQTKIAQKLCDLGVDAIIGGHPHVIQPIKLLTSKKDPNHKTVCLYSIGNAISNQRSTTVSMDSGHTEDGMLFSVTFAKYSNGDVVIDSVNVLPTWVYRSSSSSSRYYRVLPLDKSISDWGEAFDISSSAVKSAKKSYKRTMDLVGKGLDACNEYFTQLREAKQLNPDPSIPATQSQTEPVPTAPQA